MKYYYRKDTGEEISTNTPMPEEEMRAEGWRYVGEYRTEA